MLIATFGPSTGWAGKTIQYEDGRFTLEDHGVITAADVLTYDGQGHLEWAYEGLREWVTTQAQQSRPVGSLIGAAVDHSAVRSPATNRRPLLFALVAVAAVTAIILIVATFAPLSSMDEAAGPSDTGASLPQAS